MSRDEWQNPKNNPHVFQARFQQTTRIPFTRVLAEDAPRSQYHSRGKEPKTVCHWGQRKLLLSEIELLTLHGSQNNPVVYPGSASGTHITRLAEMFPAHQFHLYDQLRLI